MASLRELRRRIRSVGNIQQITRALEMLAITRLRRYQGKALAARPYTEELQRMLARLAPLAGEGALRHPLFAPRGGEAPDRKKKGAPLALLLVTSDRGYCGAYNTNVLERVRSFRDERPGTAVRLYVFGRKGYSHLVKRGEEVARYFAEPPLERMDFRAARLVAKQLVEAFLAGEFGELHVFYTRFLSMFSQRPTRLRLLPIDASSLLADAGEPGGKDAGLRDMILEPDAATIFATLVPKVLETKIYHLLLESLTSEYAARRLAMKNATEAAEEMRDDLWRLLNRARQERITRELLEIVGGAEALKSA